MKKNILKYLILGIIGLVIIGGVYYFNTKNNKITPPTENIVGSDSTEVVIDSIFTKKINFVFPNKDTELNDTIKAYIDIEFNTILKTFKDVEIKIEDNIDNVGNLNENRFISRSRTQSVADYIVKKYNIPISQMKLEGKGSTQAVSDGIIGTNPKYKWTSLEISRK